MQPVPIVLAAIVLLWCVLHPILWSWRSVTLAIGLVVGTEAVSRLPYPLGPVAATGAWAFGLSLVAFAHPALWAMPIRDQEFLRAFETRKQEFAQFAATARRLTPLEYASQLRTIATAFAELAAPTPDWGQLKDDVATDLCERAALVEQAQPRQGLKAEMQTRWDALEARFGELQRRHMSFWLAWPW